MGSSSSPLSALLEGFWSSQQHDPSEALPPAGTSFTSKCTSATTFVEADSSSFFPSASSSVSRRRGGGDDRRHVAYSGSTSSTSSFLTTGSGGVGRATTTATSFSKHTTDGALADDSEVRMEETKAKRERDPPWYREGSHPYFIRENYNHNVPSPHVGDSIPNPNLADKDLLGGGGSEESTSSSANRSLKIRQNVQEKVVIPRRGGLMNPPNEPSTVKEGTSAQHLPPSKDGKLSGPLIPGKDAPDDRGSSESASMKDALDKNPALREGIGEDIFELNEEAPGFLDTTGLDGQPLPEDIVRMNREAMTKKEPLIVVKYDDHPENLSVMGGYCPETSGTCQKNGAVGYTRAQEVDRVNFGADVNARSGGGEFGELFKGANVNAPKGAPGGAGVGPRIMKTTEYVPASLMNKSKTAKQFGLQSEPLAE
ncbi:unnamed protein product [Amoebophrya sp. A25]|nr:unnamed protein product [Amoebophrya sp. A25]|eukprot:GSA25T00002451001.1